MKKLLFFFLITVLYALDAQCQKITLIYENNFNDGIQDSVLSLGNHFKRVEDFNDSFDGTPYLTAGGIDNNFFLTLPDMDMQDSIWLQFNSYFHTTHRYGIRIQDAKWAVLYESPATSFGAFSENSKIMINISEWPRNERLRISFVRRGTYTEGSFSNNEYCHIDNLKIIGYSEDLITDIVGHHKEERKLIMVVDLLGREVNMAHIPQTPVILIYDDGSKEKTIFAQHMTHRL